MRPCSFAWSNESKYLTFNHEIERPLPNENGAAATYYLKALASLQPQASFARDVTPSGVVLDVGCGDFDRISRYVGNRRPDLQIVGIERYADATIYGPIDGSRVPSAAKRYTRIACDIETEAFPFPDHTFDAAYFAHVIEHIHEKNRALMEIRRVLKPDGLLYVETPGPGAALAFRPPWVSPKLGGTVRYHDDETHIGEPMKPAELAALLKESSFHTLRIGTVREFGVWGLPLYAAMALGGVTPGLSEATRSFLYGAGIRNLVGWGIFAIATPSPEIRDRSPSKTSPESERIAAKAIPVP